MNFEIVYGSFSGPMDVLLELIKKREMDIYDIEIHVLVDDFLDYIDHMQGPVMDSVVDFLAMASYLLEIKSRMLLPERRSEEGEEEEDPREDLVGRIVEYKRMKALAFLLEEMAEREEGAIYKKQDDFSDFSEVELINDGNGEELRDAFEKALRQFKVHEEAQKSLEKISSAKYSFKQANEKIREAFRASDEPSFFNMVRDAESRIEIVTIFLTMLELVKLQRISCRQCGKDIILSRKGTANAS
ncbi:MAG: segregation/condensation protein A [Peptoniphilus sp.]|nr:segregation/condensation protein A [Peptoniphilus sp.]MDD7362921.1 segregation/condensation protein A [Bacillota bacterium]MDY6044161.1 segregation/condensation protein A [Peptoniphilus sp.]